MNVLSKQITHDVPNSSRYLPADGQLVAVSRLEPAEACTQIESRPTGLSQNEAVERQKKFGLNAVTREGKTTILEELSARARNPLNALLLTLATASYLLGDVRAAFVITAMVILAVTTAFIQEHRSNEAAAKLRAMVHTTASVRRTPCNTDDPFCEIPMEKLVPGDIVRLSAGDMIPADLRLLEAKDLFINQATLRARPCPLRNTPAPASRTATTPSTCPTSVSWVRTSCQATRPA